MSRFLRFTTYDVVRRRTQYERRLSVYQLVGQTQTVDESKYWGKIHASDDEQDFLGYHRMIKWDIIRLNDVGSYLSPNSIRPTSPKLSHDARHGEVSGFQTIATRQDGLKNFCDKSATSPFASRKRGNRRRPRQDTGKSATSQTNQQERHGFVADLSRTSRGSRHNGISTLQSSTLWSVPTSKACRFDWNVAVFCYSKNRVRRRATTVKTSGQNIT